jgi:hypothetical protein
MTLALDPLPCPRVCFVCALCVLCVCISLASSDLVGSDGSSQYAYYLRLCGSVSSSAAASCARVSNSTGACQIQTQGSPLTWDLGEWDAQQPPVWQFIWPSAPQKGVQYTMQGARQWSDAR